MLPKAPHDWHGMEKKVPTLKSPTPSNRSTARCHGPSGHGQPAVPRGCVSTPGTRGAPSPGVQIQERSQSQATVLGVPVAGEGEGWGRRIHGTGKKRRECGLVPRVVMRGAGWVKRRGSLRKGSFFLRGIRRGATGGGKKMRGHANGTGEDGTREAGSREVGSLEVGSREIRSLEVGS